MVGFENSSVMTVSRTLVEATDRDSGGNRTEPPLEMQPAKKKRNLPGMPDRDAEVIALSPKSLLATNRFVCEICNKGFQRDQNLQLHRRGHNLPWKLKQRTGNEIRKRVYVCPEISCVHHDPLRALGDLTGIKKHFSRKHGEKKWKCERCTKKYAVQSDWKAHMKICGSKEYRCDCGSLFSRRDSFITHRAFCDVLAHESRKTQPQILALSNSDQPRQQSSPTMEAVVFPSCSPPPPPLTPSTDVLSPVNSFQSAELPENAIVMKVSGATPAACLAAATATTTASTATTTVSGGSTSNSTTVFPSMFTSSDTLEPMPLSLSSSLYVSNAGNPSFFPPPEYNLLHKLHHRYLPPSQPALSATALLQKAAQMGAKSSNTSFLHAIGLASPSSSTCNHRQNTNNGDWSNVHIKQERDDNSRLGHGIPFATAATTTTASLTDLMMGTPAPTTLDFLGLGMGGGSRGSSDAFSAYLASTGSGFHAAGAASTVSLFTGVNSGGNNRWNDSDDRKPDHL